MDVIWVSLDCQFSIVSEWKNVPAARKPKNQKLNATRTYLILISGSKLFISKMTENVVVFNGKTITITLQLESSGLIFLLSVVSS